MIDAYSREWIEVRDWCRARIEASARALEETGLDPAKTEFLRGNIAALRALLNLPASQHPARD